VIALGLALTLGAAGATVFAVIASASSSTAIPLSAFGVSISASVGETPQGATNKSLSAGFKRSW